MARLTILQASQQGFGSTLTIHRLIKDGSLPVYEEGDAKLLEVEDLIALLGEPAGTTTVTDSQTSPTAERVDIYEYNRMKSELDQKNKKNMWLAADLAEVVRELKEKEARFDAERNRLLKVLEQAQALLLREAKRAGGTLKNGDGSALTLDQFTDNGDAAGFHQNQLPPGPEPMSAGPMMEARSEAPNARMPGEEKPFMAEPAFQTEQPPEDAHSLSHLPFDNSVSAAEAMPDPANSDISVEPLADTEGDLPAITADENKKRKKSPKLKHDSPPINPMTPSLPDAEAAPRKSGLLRTTTWLVLLTLVGVGAVAFEYRIQVLKSVVKIMRTLGGT